MSDEMNMPSSLGLHEVLIVEDHINSSEIMQTILESNGVKSHVVSNAKDAMDYCKFEKPKLILMDLGLPNINGLELTKMIRCSEAQNVPIIAVTAHTGKEIEEKAISAGCNEFMEKPFLPKEFMARIYKYLH